MSPILVTLTSRNDSDFKSSNVSLKENKPDGVNPNSNVIDHYVRRMKEKLYGFRQTEFSAFMESQLFSRTYDGEISELNFFNMMI